MDPIAQIKPNTQSNKTPITKSEFMNGIIESGSSITKDKADQKIKDQLLSNDPMSAVDISDNTTTTSNINDLYTKWRLEPTNDNFKSVLKSVKPTVDYALATYQGKGNPYVETQAKILTSKAIKAYDPGYNVSLPTFITSQLRKLTRIIRDANNPIKIPERTVYEIAELKEAERELLDKNGGREPDVIELSDHMGVSVNKIEEIRKKTVKQLSEGSYFNNSISEGEDNLQIASASENNTEKTDYTKDALMYVHNASDYRERKILEWSTGYGGAKILPPKVIAQKLGISESQVSRLTAKLAVQVEQNLQALEKVYG